MYAEIYRKKDMAIITPIIKITHVPAIPPTVADRFVDEVEV